MALRNPIPPLEWTGIVQPIDQPLYWLNYPKLSSFLWSITIQLPALCFILKRHSFCSFHAITQSWGILHSMIIFRVTSHFSSESKSSDSESLCLHLQDMLWGINADAQCTRALINYRPRREDGSGCIAPSFFTSAFDRIERWASRPCRFISEEILPSTHCTENRVGPRISLEAVKKHFLSLPGLEPRHIK